MGRDTLLFALTLVCFGGFSYLARVGGDAGYWVMALGLATALLGLWQASREAVRAE
ncbi:hypothetical protein ACFO0N_09035 [Halobium salinum]|uniref:Uncharacterized protein n=1 Tax=Halobium salinum TaxID=1364940 RepID=A0ABD5PBQ8_9EURY|nr:hypothetical protein [Halobium salinum]